MPITLPKAIEILDLNVKEGHKTMPEDVKMALSVAISSMKTVKFVRGGGDWNFAALFPDEAPEENEN